MKLRCNFKEEDSAWWCACLRVFRKCRRRTHLQKSVQEADQGVHSFAGNSAAVENTERQVRFAYFGSWLSGRVAARQDVNPINDFNFASLLVVVIRLFVHRFVQKAVECSDTIRITDRDTHCVLGLEEVFHILGAHAVNVSSDGSSCWCQVLLAQAALKAQTQVDYGAVSNSICWVKKQTVGQLLWLRVQLEGALGEGRHHRHLKTHAKCRRFWALWL